MSDRSYTVVFTAGDNGQQSCIGLFSTFAAARAYATRLQEQDNPELDPELANYQATVIMTRAEWRDLA